MVGVTAGDGGADGHETIGRVQGRVGEIRAIGQGGKQSRQGADGSGKRAGVGMPKQGYCCYLLTVG